MNGEPEQPAVPGHWASGTAPFELWLRRSLQQFHAAVVNEPIPAELLRIIEDHRLKRDH